MQSQNVLPFRAIALLIDPLFSLAFIEILVASMDTPSAHIRAEESEATVAGELLLSDPNYIMAVGLVITV